MKIYERKYEDALKVLKILFIKYPNNIVILKLLGYINLKLNRLNQARKYSANILNISHNNVHVLLLLAQIHEISDFNISYNSYKKAEKLLQLSEQNVSFEIYNNIIVLLETIGESISK